MKIDYAKKKTAKNGKGYWAIKSGERWVTAWDDSWPEKVFTKGEEVACREEKQGNFTNIFPLESVSVPGRGARTTLARSANPPAAAGVPSESINLLRSILVELQKIRLAIELPKGPKTSLDEEVPPHEDSDYPGEPDEEM